MELGIAPKGPGAPVGNQNGAKGKRWREAIMRALARATGKSVDAGLDDAADKLVKLAIENGDKWAIDHIADRMDGKPRQELEHTGEEREDGTKDPIRVIFGRDA